MEIVQLPETWASQNSTVLQKDFVENLATWMEAPFFGVGFGGQRFEEIASTEMMAEGPHNLFLAILVQTGLFCVSALASLSCFFVVQNISGGLEVSSSFLLFFLGAILGIFRIHLGICTL